jgi:hypothetical protein
MFPTGLLLFMLDAHFRMLRRIRSEVVFVGVPMNIHIYMYIYICIYMYVCACVRVCVCACVPVFCFFLS